MGCFKLLLAVALQPRSGTPRVIEIFLVSHLCSNLPIHFNAKNLWAAKGAFISQHQPCKQSKEYMLDELVMEGLRVINGMDSKQKGSITNPLMLQHYEWKRLNHFHAGCLTTGQGLEWCTVSDKWSTARHTLSSRGSRSNALCCARLSPQPTGMVAFYAPTLYKEYIEHLNLLFESDRKGIFNL